MTVRRPTDRRRRAARHGAGPRRTIEKVVGVLGGMGPEATLSFYEKLIASTPASRDQDHLHVLIDSNCKVPDRSAAILHGGESPLPALSKGTQALAAAGADFVVIPCVSAHFFLQPLRRLSPLPILSILDVAAEHIRRSHPRIKTVGLLATSGTLEGRFLERRLARAGLAALAPAAADQERVMSAIHAIKDSRRGRSRAAIRRQLRGVAERLVSAGAEGIVLGCTEIPLVLQAGDTSVPLFDMVELLARAAVAAAGREPIGERS